MSDQMLCLTLLLSELGLAVAVVAREVRKCEGGLRLWLMYCVNRLYLGLGFHWRARNANTLPINRPALIVANHSSPMDPLIVWMNHHFGDPERRIRPIRFLMLRTYYDKPGVNWIARTHQCIPVDREGKDAPAMRKAVRALQAGDWVGVFPEGGLNRTREAGLIAGDPGVVWLALRAHVPIVPVFVHNSPLGRHMMEPFWTFQRVGVTYGEPIDLSAYYDHRRTPELLKQLIDEVMEELARLGGTVYRPDWSLSDFEREEQAAAEETEAVTS